MFLDDQQNSHHDLIELEISSVVISKEKTCKSFFKFYDVDRIGFLIEKYPHYLAFYWTRFYSNSF
jgi:hypothetical protein